MTKVLSLGPGRCAACTQLKALLNPCWLKGWTHPNKLCTMPSAAKPTTAGTWERSKTGSYYTWLLQTLGQPLSKMPIMEKVRKRDDFYVHPQMLAVYPGLSHARYPTVLLTNFPFAPARIPAYGLEHRRHLRPHHRFLRRQTAQTRPAHI